MVTYFSANPNGEAEVISVMLRQAGSIKKLKWDIDFADLSIKGRAVKGNIVTKYSIKRIELKEKGVSTLKPRKIWFDDTVQRLNVDARGELIGEFRGEDRLLIINQKGELKTILPELTTHFDDDMIVLEKWKPKKPISVIYFDGEKERYYVKRFLVENTSKVEHFITEHPKSQLEIVMTDWRPVAEVIFYKLRGKEQRPPMEINMEEFISVKGIKALGNQLTSDKIRQVNVLESLPYEEEEEVLAEDMEVVDEETVKGEENDTAPDDGQIGLF
jgi:topoisomerase-4 subunit A